MTIETLDEATDTRTRDLRRRAIVFALLTYLVMRVAASVLGLAVGTLSSNAPPREPPTASSVTSGVHNVWDGLDRLDAEWFTLIADHGYEVMPERSAAFFPAYPLAIRAVSALPGMPTPAAAIIVSNAAFVAALVLLYLLTTRELNEDIARRSVLVLGAFPTSFFFIAPYSESLYLLAVVWSFSEARRRRWSLAGLAGAIASATRQIGFVMTPVLLFAAYRTDRRWRAALGACLSAVGLIAYLVWWEVHSGDALAPFHAQRYWNRTIAFPLVTLSRGLYEAWISRAAPDGGYWASDALLTVLAIGGTIAIVRKVPSPYTLFAAISILLPLCYPYHGRDLLSMSRFVLVVFPAFWGMAGWLKHRWALAAWLAISIPLAAWHALLFMHLRHIY